MTVDMLRGGPEIPGPSPGTTAHTGGRLEWPPAGKSIEYGGGHDTLFREMHTTGKCAVMKEVWELCLLLKTVLIGVCSLNVCLLCEVSMVKRLIGHALGSGVSLRWHIVDVGLGDRGHKGGKATHTDHCFFEQEGIRSFSPVLINKHCSSPSSLVVTGLSSQYPATDVHRGHRSLGKRDQRRTGIDGVWWEVGLGHEKGQQQIFIVIILNSVTKIVTVANIEGVHRYDKGGYGGRLHPRITQSGAVVVHKVGKVTIYYKGGRCWVLVRTMALEPEPAGGEKFPDTACTSVSVAGCHVRLVIESTDIGVCKAGPASTCLCPTFVGIVDELGRQMYDRWGGQMRVKGGVWWSVEKTDFVFDGAGRCVGVQERAEELLLAECLVEAVMMVMACLCRGVEAQDGVD
ncbi:uncharacterized protein EV420DRAFT_1485388 [Desarmillaria tabescens]|uniref:Uncharacterized protein n=1 Tax=Armillaria tabescens TaxID=1929756 RepID=A0AA39MQN6_ARMTA|nr:uncharacterized protein EV420DRAFT_1485388 [Desarmillaria tabescens]KAK0442265.1 hypothetical protein EV420DRAFT_1485388 [Desarmillaria tabescens]